MLNIFPEKRATAADVLQSRWLNGKSDGHLCTDDNEVKDNMNTFIESKSAYLYFRELKHYNSDQYFADVGENGSDTDSEDDHLGFRENFFFYQK